MAPSPSTPNRASLEQIQRQIAPSNKAYLLMHNRYQRCSRICKTYTNMIDDQQITAPTRYLWLQGVAKWTAPLASSTLAIAGYRAQAFLSPRIPAKAVYMSPGRTKVLG